MDLKYLLIFVTVAALAVAAVALLRCRAVRSVVSGKDAAIALLQKEIENQDKSVKNLSKMYDSVLEYDKNKTEFFSNIIHELKTPISVILGAIQLAEAKLDASGGKENGLMKNYRIIRQNCYRLIRLVNNLLDFTRLDSGYLKLNLANCNITWFAEEIAQSVIPYARQKNIELVFDTQCEEIYTAVDMEKLERTVLNLLSNAIKFTGPSGSIFISTYSAEGKACISVRDTGIGIPAEKQRLIFNRFQQVGSELSRDNEGSGIGLSIAKSFVEMHNGSIKLKSEEGMGSEFIIELPVRHIDQEQKDNMPEMQFKMAEAVNIEFSSVHPSA
jgi:two-component system cell cycle sensor histidine kinase PleC